MYYCKKLILTTTLLSSAVAPVALLQRQLPHVRVKELPSSKPILLVVIAQTAASAAPTKALLHAAQLYDGNTAWRTIWSS